jgi:hypothetical protein
MDKFVCANLALQHFKNKEHTLEYEEFAGNKFEFRTYEVEVAIFEDDFHKAPNIKAIRVRLSDDEYLCLLQWQLQNPQYGFNHYDIDTDAMIAIESKVEEVFFPDGNIGTYAVYLTEIRKDAEMILRSLNNEK